MKNKILIFIVGIYIISFSLISIIVPDRKISTSERRYLTKFPNYELNSKWINEVDKYFLDHFILRDELRSIKAYYSYDLLKQIINNNIYLDNDYIFKIDYPTNIKSINNFNDTIMKLKEMLGSNNNVFLMVIPDKNFYNKNNDFLKIDYDFLYNKTQKLGIKNIDLRDILTLNDYYYTDTHWKQENLQKVIKKMDSIMKFNYKPIEYKWNYYNEFYGVLYSESGYYHKPEKLSYITNDNFKGIDVKYLENKNLNTINNEENLYKFDSYEIFLDGANSLIEINNNNIDNNRELIIFRDSFASSLTPLLVNYYEKIILIDNRYIASNYFKNMDFNNKDVLFMYSTMFINNSMSLKG